MKINKYKYLKNSQYEVTIEEEKYIISEDIIIKHEILLKKEIAKKELEEILKEQGYYEAYYKAIKYISSKFRTSKEIYKYLEKYQYEKNIIEKVIKQLEKEKYIDEQIYTNAYIKDEINLKQHGPLKIKKDLLDLGISEETINKNLKLFTEDIIKEKINKIITKEIKLNKNKSSYILKNKISNKLITLGYEKKDFIQLLEKIKIDEKDIYEKEYNKLYQKLSKKYSGKELELKIKQKLYSKGFTNQQ